MTVGLVNWSPASAVHVPPDDEKRKTDPPLKHAQTHKHTERPTHLSMPKPSMLLSRTSPPKYLAYTRLNGRPIPNPANGGNGFSTVAAAAPDDGRGIVAAQPRRRDNRTCRERLHVGGRREGGRERETDREGA